MLTVVHRLVTVSDVFECQLYLRIDLTEAEAELSPPAAAQQINEN